jgi:hypothetical protein
LVVVIPSQRGIHLGQRKMGTVFLDRLRVPPLGQMVKHYLDDLNVGVIHPRTPVFIEANMWNGVRLCYHGTTLPESGRESRPPPTCVSRTDEVQIGEDALWLRRAFHILYFMLCLSSIST